jgi:hypothetical protein
VKAVISVRSAHAGKAAGGNQTAAERSQPLDAVVSIGARCAYTAMAEPCERMFVVERINNIECTVDNDFIPQTGAGIDPGDARAATKAIIENRGFNAAKLAGVDYFICPSIFFLSGRHCDFLSHCVYHNCLAFYTEIAHKTQAKSVVDTTIPQS